MSFAGIDTPFSRTGISKADLFAFKARAWNGNPQTTEVVRGSLKLETNGFVAVVDVEFGVHVPYVILDCFLLQVKIGRDFTIGPPLSYKS